MVQIVRHQHLAQEEPDRRPDGLFAPDQIPGDADDPRAGQGRLFPGSQGPGTEGIQGQEGGPSPLDFFQIGDGILGRPGILGDDVLEGTAQGRFQGGYIGILHGKQFCHHPADLRPESCLGIQYGPDPFAEPFMFPFHGGKHLETGFFLVQGPPVLIQAGFLFPVGPDALFQVPVQLEGLFFQLVFPVFQGLQPVFFLLEGPCDTFQAFFRFPDLFLQLFLLPVEPFLFLADPRQFVPGHHQGPHAVESLLLIGLEFFFPGFHQAREGFLFCGGLFQQVPGPVLGFFQPVVFLGDQPQIFLAPGQFLLQSGTGFGQLVHPVPALLDPLFLDRFLAPVACGFLFPGQDLFLAGAVGSFLILELLFQGLFLAGEFSGQIRQFLQLSFQGPDLFLQPGLFPFQGSQLGQQTGHLHLPEPAADFPVLPGLFRRRFQGHQLVFDFALDILDPQQVGGGVIQFPQGFLLPQPVFGDACGLFKDGPPVFRTAVEDLVDLVLADDGKGSPAQTGIRKQGHHILQPAVLPIDDVFAVPAPEHPALERDLVEIHRQAVIRVVEHQIHFRHAHGPPAAAAGENHIFHFGAPEVFHALFPQHPADGIGDVAFAAAVGPHNGRDPRPKVDIHFIRKGLEPMG